MANPFLVLGGIAVGIITAAFGVLAVPGWVAAAQDASAMNDVAQVSIAQAASLSKTGAAASAVAGLSGSGVEVSLGNTEKTLTAADPTGKHWLALSRSASGAYFARTSDAATIGEGKTVESAIENTGASISGAAGARVTGKNVPVPAKHALADILHTNLFENPDARSVTGFGEFWGAGGGAGTMQVVDAAWTESGKAVRFTRTRLAADPGRGNWGHFDLRPYRWMKPSTRYTVVWEFVGSGGYNVVGAVQGYPSPLQNVAGSPADPKPAGATPRRVWATFDMGPTIDPAWQAYVSNNMVVGEWIEFGNIDMYEGDYDPNRPFISGARNAGDLQTAWLGTPDASKTVAFR
ncbi:hypothetical protein [Microbacterium sp. 77mftsu3.1]|uniref:hypothetical protein n=1 Tax=Microbacterium sp. 77mftsu3.1 TaxID=1761802 RepID=UPI00035E40D5|nr:hypothetical protein [Microbacterium sp. 77mftsu3.1]SDH49607.1 hypothetical protein SAMN04488590_3443 [Microbacterium sp. 77mftsu3.1]